MVWTCQIPIGKENKKGGRVMSDDNDGIARAGVGSRTKAKKQQVMTGVLSLFGS